MNVLLINPIDIFPNLLKNFQDMIPGLVITGNFEDVYGMVKGMEISKLCIIIGGYNYSKSQFNNISGQKATEEIHKIDPTLPILIWSGRDDCARVVIKEKEIYLESCYFSSENYFKITKKFYSSYLTSADIPACENPISTKPTF